MGDKSKIEWTEATWNPVTGCSRVSAGCDNCYAIRQAHRIQAMGNTDAYDGTTRKRKSGALDWTGKVNLLPDRLEQPLRWKRPRRIFVNSMSDLFHPSVPFEFVDKVFAVMALAQQHTFQILTKRPERMAEYLLEHAAGGRHVWVAAQQTDATKHVRRGEPAWPLPNVWLGTSVEDQEAANARIPHLLDCPAAVRWLSCEPLLGPVKLHGWGHDWLEGWDHDVGRDHNGDPEPYQIQTERIDWVVAGGESGPGARPMHPEWARSLRDQCAGTDVAFHFKQWGNWIEHHPASGGDLGGDMRDGLIRKLTLDREDDGHYRRGDVFMCRVSKHEAGRELDGRTWDEYPESEVPA